jgi:RNA polymerase sigma factor (sigma-70 family)
MAAMINRRAAGRSDLSILFSAGALGAMSDGRLLDLFRERRDEAGSEAFRVLLERHGPMVRGVCLGIVGDRHEADDAFQATFLVLVRCAGRIRKTESLGPWLHGVALRVARRAAKRARVERLKVVTVDHETLAGQAARSATAVDSHETAAIHREIDRLPDRDRLPIIAYCLEGRSYDEAARNLGLSEPAFRGRLQRARQKLANRLKAHGMLGDQRITPRHLTMLPPASLIGSTLNLAVHEAARLLGPASSVVPVSVLSLVHGVMFTMSIASIKTVVAVVMISACAIGTAVVASQGPKAGGQPDNNQQIGELIRQDKPIEGVHIGPKPTIPPLPREDPQAANELYKKQQEELRARTEAINAFLEQTIDIDFPEVLTFEDFLNRMIEISKRGGKERVPMYVDPLGLQEAGAAMNSSVTIDVKSLHSEKQKQKVRHFLSWHLARSQLAYYVRDGFLLITSRVAANEAKIELLEEKLEYYRTSGMMHPNPPRFPE